MGCSRQERGEKAENAEDADDPADVEDRLPFRWYLSLCQGVLSAEGLEVDPSNFGSAVQAHRALAHEFAAALRAVGIHLGHLAVELAVPQIDLLDPLDEFCVGAAMLLLENRPQCFGQHEEFLHVALDEFILGTDVGRSPGTGFAAIAVLRVQQVDRTGEKNNLQSWLCILWNRSDTATVAGFV